MYLCSPAVYMYHGENSLKTLVETCRDGHPKALLPGSNAVNCNLKSIKMVFNYNRFTGDKQETENWAENVMYAQDSVWALGRECT